MMKIDPEQITIRPMKEDDLEAIVAIDTVYLGSDRLDYYKEKLVAATKGAGINTSLVAEFEGEIVGFMIGALYKGEFGIPETTATLHTIGVLPVAAGKGIATKLLQQFRNQVKKLGVGTIHTVVDWNDGNLLLFFQRSGFVPSSRLSLELALA